MQNTFYNQGCTCIILRKSLLYYTFNHANKRELKTALFRLCLKDMVFGVLHAIMQKIITYLQTRYLHITHSYSYHNV